MHGSWYELREFLHHVFHTYKTKGRPNPVPPQFQNDAIAKKTSWDPNQQGGMNWRSHKLVKSDQGQLRVKATACFSCCSGCIVLPLGLLFLGMGVVAFGRLSELGGAFWGSLLGAVCVILGVSLLLGTVLVVSGLSGGVVLCRQEGCLWKRGVYGAQRLVKKDSSLAQAGHDRKMPLDEVYAVQLLGEFVSPDKVESFMILTDSDETLYERNLEMRQRQYHSYELNLVLRTGERITMMHHGGKGASRGDGTRVAQFLNVQLWDVI